MDGHDRCDVRGRRQPLAFQEATLTALGPIQFGHGPDADDAFVFEPLIHGRVDTEGLEFVHRQLPFADLNRNAGGAHPPHVSMLSAATLARLTDRFHVLPFGGSFVRTMGPTLVALRGAALPKFARALVAVPGRGTTAELLLRLALPDVRLVSVPYEEVASVVARGDVEAGVVIHEEQLGFERLGLIRITDLGLRWKQRHEMPTPLAVCAIRADLSPVLRDRIVRVLERSLAACRAQPELPMQFARGFTGAQDADLADVLVEEYVSDETYALSAAGRRAIELLVGQAQRLFVPPVPTFAGAA